MANPIRVCAPWEVAGLLPGALAGDYVLAPVPDGAAASLLRPTEPVPEPEVAVIVTTSGSTGSPKGVLLSGPAITAAAAAFRQRYGTFTWTCVLPTHYVAGLMVVARGLLDQPTGGAGVRYANRDLSDLPDPNPTAGRNAISVVPTQLARALRSSDTSERLARYDLVLVGGAALSADLAARSREAGIAVRQSYGMSETCGGCVVDGLPLPGVHVDIDQTGRVSIGGTAVFSGYRGDPQATAAALVGGWLVTQDRGEWLVGPDGESRLHILGRFDDVVISGGVNVDLAAVQQAVDGLSRGETAVFGVPDDEWGTRVALAVTGPSPDLAWWQDALRPALGASALPRQLLRLVSLPRTSSGKVDRQRLRELALAAS